MALRVRRIESLDPQISKVVFEGEPVSTSEDISTDEILEIYNKRQRLEGEPSADYSAERSIEAHGWMRSYDSSDQELER